MVTSEVAVSNGLSSAFSGCNRQIRQERTAASEPEASTAIPFSALGGVGGDRGRATSPVVTGDGDGVLNITETRATLGRTARLECTAKNISGKKMVRETDPGNALSIDPGKVRTVSHHLLLHYKFNWSIRQNTKQYKKTLYLQLGNCVILLDYLYFVMKGPSEAKCLIFHVSDISPIDFNVQIGVE